MEKVQFTTVVWGDWHVDAFLSLGIPSLLAPNNLPSFVKKHQALYHISTSKRDAERFRQSEAFANLQSVIPVRLVTMGPHAFEGDTLDDQITNQHRRLEEAMAAARADRAMPIQMAPDVCWGDGSFGRLAELITSSRSVVYIKHARVIDETIRPAILAVCAGQERGIIRLTHREIAALAMKHLHPLFAMYLPDSENWAEHAEYSLWPVKREGFQLRVLATDGFVFDRHAKPDAALRSQLTSSMADIVFAGPDEISGLSLTPLAKDVNWYATPNRPDAIRSGAWWRLFDHPHNKIVSDKHVNFAATEPTRHLWREVDRRSNRWVNRVRASLRFVQILQKLRENPLCSRASVVASAAVHHAVLYRLVAGPNPMTVFVPTDAALEDLPPWFWEKLMDCRDASDLISIFRHHVIGSARPLGPPSADRKLARGDGCSIGAKIVDEMKTDGGDQIYLIDRVFLFSGADSCMSSVLHGRWARQVPIASLLGAMTARLV